MAGRRIWRISAVGAPGRSCSVPLCVLEGQLVSSGLSNGIPLHGLWWTDAPGILMLEKVGGTGMRRVFWTVLGVLFGAILVPVVSPILLRASRPFAKSATKAGLQAYRTGHEKLALLKENLADILAESRHEL